MNENGNIIESDINLYAVQVLDFKSKDGDVKGYKIFYTRSVVGEYKDNYLGGKAEDCFVKDDNYKLLIDKLRLKTFPVKAKVRCSIQSLDKPPKVVSLVI